MEKSGEVCCAHCTCMAGLGEACTHVAAVLFFLEAKVRITGQPTCTEQSCQWILPAFQKEIPYLPITDIDFTAPNSKRYKIDQSIVAMNNSMISLSSSSTSSYQQKATPPDSTELGAFFDSLSKCGTNPAILSIVPKFSGQYIPKIRNGMLPTPLQSLYCSKYLTYNYKDLLLVCDSIDVSISNDMAKAVEQETTQQASSKLWFKFRAGRITASRMKQACHTDPALPSQSLIKSICYPEAYKFISKATQWGCKHEATACDHYKSIQCSNHQSFSLKHSGLVLNPDWPHLGASPDGVVTCKCCGEGVLEIKCPFCRNDEDVEVTASSSKSCLIQNSDSSLHLDRNHTYYYQVQTQIFICKVDYCDFCVCTFPDNSPSLHIERIFEDKELWKSCTEKTVYFFKYCILPELVGKWYTKPLPLPASLLTTTTNTPVSNDKTLYCYCRNPEPREGSSSSEMIACDNPHCSVEWFHTKCLKIKSIPKGNWFCPDCRKLPEFSGKRKKTEE